LKLKPCTLVMTLSFRETICAATTRTQEWLTENLPDFLTSQDWSTSSLDLNPLD
jgi:hypothetical protein